MMLYRFVCILKAFFSCQFNSVLPAIEKFEFWRFVVGTSTWLWAYASRNVGRETSAELSQIHSLPSFRLYFRRSG